METASLTWRFESPSGLLGCGVDLESAERFSKWAAGIDTPAFVFTPAEIAHAASLPDPALGLAVAFCCKEAVFKALGGPYAFTECELLYRPGMTGGEIALNENLRRASGIGRAVAFIRTGAAAGGDVLVAVCLLAGDGEKEGA